MDPLEKLPKNWKELLSVDENKDTDVVAVSSFNGRGKVGGSLEVTDAFREIGQTSEKNGTGATCK